jgi:hypothetical protein
MFTVSDDILKQIEEVDRLIDVVSSALYATRVDKSAVNNSFGYSKTLNELNKKYKNDSWIELAEIEGVKADLLQNDLALLKQKLQHAKNLNTINRG